MMTSQQVTPELRQWIADQVAAGHASDAILKAMLQSGWSEPVATMVLRETLISLRAAAPVVQPTQAAQVVPTSQVVTPGSRVPEPALQEGASVVWAGDKHVQVLTLMTHPRVIVFGGLLSPEECDEMVALARPRLVRSETVQLNTGASEVNEARTSRGMFFGRGENELCQRIEARIAALVQWPLENGEGLQILHYQPGAEYRPHYDYFDPAQPGTPNILKRGGQRVATLVMYLNAPVRGGATTFPDVKLEVAPLKGNAVFFSYDRPDPSTHTLHGGAPVLEGEKWVATKWLREGRFD